jgi:hypothetical protein
MFARLAHRPLLNNLRLTQRPIFVSDGELFLCLAASCFERQPRKIYLCNDKRKRVAFDKRLDVIFRVCDKAANECWRKLLCGVSFEEKEFNYDDSVVKLKKYHRRSYE